MENSGKENERDHGQIKIVYYIWAKGEGLF